MLRSFMRTGGIAALAVLLSSCVWAQEPSIPQRLKQKRQQAVRVLASFDAAKNASFASRVKIYCRLQQTAIPMLPELGSIGDLEESYAELAQTKTTTREEEINRQRTLLAWRERLLAAYENAEACEGSLLNGFGSLPTKEEDDETIANDRSLIATIDQLLAAYAKRDKK